MNEIQFLNVLAVMSEALTAKGDELEMLQHKVGLMTAKLEEAKDDLADLDWYKSEYERLSELYAKTKEELVRLTPNPTQHELLQKASVWMASTGQFILYTKETCTYNPQDVGKLDRIKMIKGVRELTCWGLKESKDFVDQWLTDHGLL